MYLLFGKVEEDEKQKVVPCEEEQLKRVPKN